MSGLSEGVRQKIAGFLDMVKGLATSVINVIKNALKIKSPSQVMAKLGAQTAEGFQQGIASMGGIGVNMPTTQQMQSGIPMQSMAPALSSAGGGDTYIFQGVSFSEEQMQTINRWLGKQAKRKGASSL